MQTITYHRKAVGLLTILLIGVFVWTLTAGDLNPPGVPGSTMKTLDEVEPRIAINAENTPGDPNNTYIISEPGSYCLTGNFTSNFKHGILIDADDVTVDLMGYRLWSSYSKPLGNNEDFDGIHLAADRKNIDIRNGTIASDNTTLHLLTFRGFRYGIYAESGSRGITVDTIRVTNARDDGIYLPGNNHTVRNCTCLYNEGMGIDLYENCKALDNTCCENGVHGILLRDGSTARGNTCNENISCGILIWSDCKVVDNTCCLNGSRGISGTGSYRSVVIGNLVNENGKWSEGSGSVGGMCLANDCVIRNNTICENATNSDSTGDLFGIQCSHRCVIADNTINENGRYADNASEISGISALGGCTITNNSVSNTGYYSTSGAIYGIIVQDGSTVSHNSCYSTAVMGTSGTIAGLSLGEHCLADHNTIYSTLGTNLQAPSSCVLDSNLAP